VVNTCTLTFSQFIFYLFITVPSVLYYYGILKITEKPSEYRKPLDWQTPKGRVVPHADQEKCRHEVWPSGVLRSDRHRKHTNRQCIPP